VKKLLILAAILIAAPTYGQTRTVDGNAQGKYFNDVWTSWSDYPIHVYVDLEANVYIRGGESLLKATGHISGKQLKQMIALLKKSAVWAEKAKDNQIEITKPLGSFLTETEYHKQGVDLKFFSADKGNQTDVILHIHDFDNMFTEIKLYLNEDQVQALLGLLQKVPETYRELKSQKDKSRMLR